jgi:hypothetical protein
MGKPSWSRGFQLWRRGPLGWGECEERSIARRWAWSHADTGSMSDVGIRSEVEHLQSHTAALARRLKLLILNT